MRFHSYNVLAALCSLAVADPSFTVPAAGASIAAGTAITVTWVESNLAPLISTLSTYQLFLCAGGDTDASMGQLQTLVSTGSFAAGDSVITVAIEPNVGGSGTDAYFLKMISVATEGGTVINYSDRFTLTGMTGTFAAAVSAAVLAITDTAGPTRVDNVGTVAATTAAAAGEGEYAIAYQSQTGLTKYAPMQPIPPTKITATNTSPLHPTSSYSLATTYLAPASILTTLTESQTYSVSSRENTEAAASQPTGDMKKFLARWADEE